MAFERDVRVALDPAAHFRGRLIVDMSANELCEVLAHKALELRCCYSVMTGDKAAIVAAMMRERGLL